jgi:DNA-binding IscR family transcriptional regulator
MKAVLSAVEEEIKPVDCGDGHGSPSANPAACGSIRLWRKLEDAIDKTLTETTLEELCEVGGADQKDMHIPNFQVSI